MSQKVRRKKQSHVPRRSGWNKRKVLLAIILVSSLAGIILAQWRTKKTAPRSLPLNPQTSPTPQLSKEYIYSGGKLVAIEEPSNVTGSGPAPTNLLATATSGTSVSLTWTAPSTGSIASYQVERSQSVNGPYAALNPNPTTTSFTDSNASAGIAYLYRVRAVYTGGSGYSSYSNPDLATTIIFTDDPLTANATTIKAVHLDQLRQAVNAVRATAGLGANTWTDATLLGVFAKAVHVQELRTGLDQALTALSMTVSSYTDASLPGVFIKKAHIEELRTRVK